VTDLVDKSSAPLSAEAHFERLLSPHRIETRLAFFEIDEVGLPAISATFIHPRFRQSKVLVDELCDKLISRITSFCMTRAERREAKMLDSQYEYETAATDELNAKARRLFINALNKPSRSGEGGELLLFVLVEEHLRAPLLVSKMRLKTNAQMPVYGSDGIHAGWDTDSNSLILYLGESKLHKTLDAAVRDAVKSLEGLISNAEERMTHELNLASSYCDLDGMSEEMKKEMLLYLNPWDTVESTKREDRYAVLLGFNEKSYAELVNMPPKEVEEKFKELYKKTIKDKLEYTKNKFEEQGISLESVDLFFFPVPSVDEFRKSFQSKING